MPRVSSSRAALVFMNGRSRNPPSVAGILTRRSAAVPKVVIYTKDACPYCVRAKNLFQSLHVPFEEVNLEARS